MLDAAKKFFHKIQINNRQHYVDKLYEKEGLSEEVLNKQVEVNSLRHEYDISDESKRVYDRFVQ